MKPIEKYANTLENSLLEHGDGWVPCDEAQSKAVRAVIEAFVEDLAREMCGYCRDGREMSLAFAMTFHVVGATVRPCNAAVVREDAGRLLEEPNAE